MCARNIDVAPEAQPGASFCAIRKFRAATFLNAGVTGRDRTRRTARAVARILRPVAPQQFRDRGP